MYPSSDRPKVLRKHILELPADAYDALGIPVLVVAFLPPKDPGIQEGTAVLYIYHPFT